jgi:hypothetical protein
MTMVATFDAGVHIDSLRQWWQNSARPKTRGQIRVEMYGGGIRWGCSCQTYTPPGHSIPCIPMTNGPCPAHCPDCGASR